MDDIFGLEPFALLYQDTSGYWTTNASCRGVSINVYTADQVKQAIKAQDEIWCKAIIATQYDDGKRLVCDSEKLLHYLNTHKAIRNQETNNAITD